MNLHPIAFFYCSNNNIFHAQQNTCLLSSSFPSAKPKQEIKSGNGFYIHKEPTNSIRRSICLFVTRSLPKPTWQNSNNVFLGREN
jgi:hypothetical protein